MITGGGVLSLNILLKELKATELMKSSRPKLKTSTNPPDHSASRSRSGSRRFFHGWRSRNRGIFM
jgi:hypothetical protein